MHIGYFIHALYSENKTFCYNISFLLEYLLVIILVLCLNLGLIVFLLLYFVEKYRKFTMGPVRLVSSLRCRGMQHEGNILVFFQHSLFIIMK